MFSANQTATGERKDSLVNTEQTGHFVWNLATYDLREAVNITAEQVPHGVDEFDRAGLEKEKAKLTDIPMVKASPVKFECEYYTTIRLPGQGAMGSASIVIGKVLAIHIDEDVLTDGILDIRKTQPIARCGYYQYAVIRDTFEMKIPGSEMTNVGLEGNSKKSKEAARQQMERSQSTAGVTTSSSGEV